MGWSRAIALLVLTGGTLGCVDGDSGLGPDDDAGPTDRDGSPDASQPAVSGMTVEFVILGPDGEPVDDGNLDFETFEISRITLQLHQLTLLGDSAPSGSQVQPSYALEHPREARLWVNYAAAPPGIYGRFDFRVERTYTYDEPPPGFDGDRLSMRVLGEGPIDGRIREFEYTDEAKINVKLSFEEEVDPGRPGRVVVEFDVGQWFESVRWDDIERTDGRGGGNGPGNGGGNGPGDGGPGDGGPDDDDPDDDPDLGGDDDDDVVVISGEENQEAAQALREGLVGALRARP